MVKEEQSGPGKYERMQRGTWETVRGVRTTEKYNTEENELDF